jgi:DNA-binding transcriptional LysR family regulator
MDWDDLRFVLAVARTGSALRAARTLKVNQTTVMRRIAHIESDIGADLFESGQNGQTLTPLGESVAAAAEKIESEVLALQSAISARQRVLSGTVRFTSSEVFANRIVAPCLQLFRKQHPGVTVELVAEDRRLDLSRNEADVALRASSRPEGAGIVAQRLPDAAWSVYCSRGYAEEHGVPAGPNELNGHAAVALDAAMSNVPPFQWLAQVAPNASVSARSNSLTNLVSAVKAGLGVGALPCFVGDAETDLVRCFQPIRELDSEVWLIVCEELKQAPHVRAFVDFLAAHVHGMKKQLSGT